MTGLCLALFCLGDTVCEVLSLMKALTVRHPEPSGKC